MIQPIISLFFQGNIASQRITPANQNVLRIGTSTSFTFGGWYRLYRKTATEGTDNQTLLISEYDYSANQGYLFQATNNGNVGVFMGNTWVTSGNNIFTFNIWQHITCRVSGSTLDIFVNGNKVYTNSSISRKTGTGGSCYFGEETGSYRTIYGKCRSLFAAQSALSDGEISAIATNNTYPTVGVLYHLSEGSGTTATDASGNTNNGTIAGATYSYESPEQPYSSAPLRPTIRNFGTSMRFSGSQFVNFPSQTSNRFLATGQYTWMGWINFTGKLGPISYGACRFVTKNAGTGLGMRIAIDRTSWNCQNLNTFATWSVKNPFTGLTNQWVHWAVTYDAGKKMVNFYVNGRPFAATQNIASDFWTATQSDTTGPWRIGSDWDQEGGVYLMDEFVMVNEALTAADIAEAYTKGYYGQNVAIYAKFDEGSGSTVIDYSGNNNNGTVNSSTYSTIVPMTTRATGTRTIIPTTRTTPTKPNKIYPVATSCHLDRLNSTQLTNQLQLMQAAGIKWVRFDFVWSEIQPTNGSSFTWTKYDNIVDTALTYGIETIALPVTYGCPGWANSNQGGGYPPTNNSDFANFCQNIASHFIGRIHLIEISNEPNGSTFWQPAPNTVAYTSLMIASYDAIKVGNPDAKVISGGLAAGGWGGGQDADGFLSTMYANGAQGKFDMFGIHPYATGNHPDICFRMLDKCRKIMNANGDHDKIMLITELGWPSNLKGSTATYGVTEEIQAEFIRLTYEKITRGDYQYAPIFFLYDFYNDGTDYTQSEHNFGVVRQDYTLKPGYYALQNAARDFTERFTAVNPY